MLFEVFLILLISYGCSKKDRIIIIKAAHVTSIDHPFQLGLLKFKEIVEKETNNKINIKIYPSTQLGNERDLIEGMQLGTVQIAPTANAPLSSWVPELMIFDLPYIFRNAEHAEKVLNGAIGKELALKTEQFGIKILAFWTAGTRNIFTKKPINLPIDLQGLKIRVMENPIHIETFNLFGAQATPMASGEVFTALQQGVIDGAENDPNSFYTFGYWQITKFYSMTQHVYGAAPFMISKKFFDNLSEEQKIIIQNAAITARDYQIKTAKDITKQSLKKLAKEGVKIIYPELSEFKKIAQRIYKKFENKIDTSLIKKIEATK
ncbi:TRAP transporter substrate-binding protein [candidate division KSB1 bacterium]